MATASDVQILVTPPGGSPFDLTRYATIAGATFASNANATPGQAQIIMRDLDRELAFVTGSRLKCIIDGQSMWSGFGLRIGKGNFLPAGDGKPADETSTRQFMLTGVDNNILFDKRYIRRTSNYLTQLPLVTASTYDGELLRTLLSTYADMPDWLDISTFIDDVYQHPDSVDAAANKGWAWLAQGTKIRAQFEDLARASGAVYYIGPDDAVHYHALQDIESPWGFSDKPNNAPIIGAGGFEGAYWGFRELNADEDGGDLATDALVWGGSPFAGTGTTVFKRATDDDLEAIHGKWQLAETHFNETNYKTQQTVNQRANVIVFGNPSGDPGGPGGPGTVVGEGPRGLRYPQYSFGLTWTTRNVPTLSGTARHLYPGDLVPIQLWAFSEDEGDTAFTRLLPMRSLAIAFPGGTSEGKAHVEFRGAFDLRNEDPFTLWKYIRKQEPVIVTQTLGVATDDTDPGEFHYGDYGSFTPTPATDGVETVFTIPVGYVPGTVTFYLNNIPQRLNIDWFESDPDAGELTFSEPPVATDYLFVTCRTLDG